MHESKNELPVAMETDVAKIQEVYWGDMHISRETYNEPFDVTPLLKGLPDNLDQCPHWGYVLKGGFRNRYKDGLIIRGVVPMLSNLSTRSLSERRGVF